ncbi:MAG TPA: NAD-dependent epimerase/dehydratase family protein [Candidatus Binatia bacterium]
MNLEPSASRATREILITGATGYVGQRLALALLQRGYRVRALTRAASAAQIPKGAAVIVGDALNADSVSGALQPGDTIVHLVGTPHPNPSKARQFQEVDFVSIRATVEAAKRVPPSHLIYVSVAHPAPVMKAFIEVRSAGEAMIRDAQLTATVLRPWYILGPGHWWPLALIPFYKIAEMLPSWRASAQRLGLVSIKQMVNALVNAVENPPPREALRIVEVPEIKSAT